MSIKLTYRTLREMEFIKAFNTLSRYPNFEKFETKKRIYKIGKQLDAHLDEVADLHTKLVETYCKKDDEGNIVPRPDGKPGTFVVEESRQEEWKKALAEFDATEVELPDTKKIKGQHLDKVPVTPTELIWLEPLIDME